MSQYRAHFVPGNVDPSGRRKVCCGVQIGVLIKENFGRTIECAAGKTADECCRQHPKFNGLFEEDYIGPASEGACGRHTPTGCAAAVLALRGGAAGPQALKPKAGPLVIPTIIIGLAIATELGKEGCPKPEPTRDPWIPPPVDPPDCDDDDDDDDDDHCKSEYENCLKTVMSTWSGRQRNRCWNCRKACEATGSWAGRMNGLNCRYWETEDLYP